DLTKKRTSTFFEDGIVGHVPFADPVCKLLASALSEAAASGGVRVHRGGTYVCIEGPQFSTRAESLLYRSWGVSVIGMTNVTEAKLAREAELPFATLALATDYDCWHDAHDDVTVEAVVSVLKANVQNARKAIVALSTRLPAKSIAHGAMKHAVMTDPKHITAAVREKY